MPTQTFPCPFCAKKMGVGIELLGKKVRCPHCNQVLVAPAPAAMPVEAPAPIPVVAAPPPPSPPPADVPSFNLPTQESRESIFGEQVDESDDVFSSSDPKKLQFVEMPPAQVQAVPPPPAAVEPPPAPPAPEPSIPTSAEAENPFAQLTFEAPPPPPPPAPIPVVVQPIPVPPPPPPPPPPVEVVQPVPVVAPVEAPPPIAHANPWASPEPSAIAPVPTLVPVPDPAPIEDSPFSSVEAPRADRGRERGGEDQPARRSRPATAAGGPPLFRTGFFILAPYALIVTILAIYGLFLKSGVPAGHPLANLPDTIGEFGPAEKRKSGKLRIPEGDIPADQKVALGSKLEIGQLEIEPLAVNQRKLRIFAEGRTGAKQQTELTTSPALVMTMRIRNTSDDLTLHPLDPAFNRRTTGDEKIGTGLVVGKAAFWGGAISWPFSERVKRMYEEAQEADVTPLKPGESREYVVFSAASSRVVSAVKNASDPILWRVQVRRGRIDFDGKDVPVTAIIGVEFHSSDVKDPD
jgi:hypothetical protein